MLPMTLSRWAPSGLDRADRGQQQMRLLVPQSDRCKSKSVVVVVKKDQEKSAWANEQMDRAILKAMNAAPGSR